MKLDFSSYPLRANAYSKRPMAILDAESRTGLSAIMEIALIETGSRVAREHWQHNQLQNLLNHARQRSPFWRKRIGGISHSPIGLASLPILTRHDVNTQVTSEGPLLQVTDGITTNSNKTSESSGIPVSFFYSSANARYNEMRYVAQYFIEGRDLSLNRTRLYNAIATKALPKSGISVQRNPSWVGALAPLIRSGANKHIDYRNPNIEELVKEIENDDIGFLVATPRILDTIHSSCGVDFLKRRKTEL